MYDLVTTHFRLYPDAVSFQSSNRWDIAGATAFGFHVVMLEEARNRPPPPFETVEPQIRQALSEAGY